MNIYAVTSLLALITNLGICIFVYLNNRTSWINRLCSLFFLSISLWIIGCFTESLTGSKSVALFIDKILYTGLILMPAINTQFIHTVIGIKRPKTVRSIYFISSVFLLLNWSGLRKFFITDVIHKYPFRFIAVPSTGWYLFFLCLLAVTFYWMYTIFESFKVSSGQKHVQLKYFFIAYLLGSFTCMMYLFLVLNIQTPPIDNFTGMLFAVMIAYAIVRHKLLDIEVVIKKTIVFAGLLASVFAILVLPTLLIQEYIFRGASSSGKLLGLTLSGVIIILSLRRVENFLINVTDKYLFQKKYDYRELLKTFTAEVLTVVNLDKLVNLTVDKLSDIVKINSCAVLLFDDTKQQFNVIASQNIKDPRVTLIKPDGIVTFLEQTQGYLLKKELIEKKIYIPPSIQEIINKLNAELIIPMVLHNEVMGILALGKKKSDEDYTPDDLAILLPLARTLAIAISNARLFDELGKAQAEAAQNEKMAVIGTLSAGINHEICNPLGIARGQCEAFLLNVKDGLYNNKSPQELLEKAKDIMAKVIKETDRATAITKKLSSFAKPAKGEAELVNIDKEVDDVLGLVGYELKLEKIEFEKQIGKDLPNISVDKKQFQEVLFNLIRNAGQAIGEKGKITVAAKQDQGKVAINVKDTGSGIPEDKLKELFNPFFTTKDPGKGTGLGLFIVRQVVEKNGGRIYLKETKIGEGTTFTVEFPVAVTHESRV
jgi:signal transduction histidine kinase